MSFSSIALALIGRAERRIGVRLDYVRHIARTSIRLLMRYNRIFGMIDPCRHVPAGPYHAVRIRAALAADCGTCVEAEMNLARNAGLTPDWIDGILQCRATEPVTRDAIELADAVVARRRDAPETRERLRDAIGDAGLIELSLAMNGAAMLPGIKRSLGYATSCQIDVLRRSLQG